MPHSSGGGSHGGGSHGGSHSSSHGGSGGSRSGISKTPYPGAKRYRYYRGGVERYIYSKTPPSEAFSPVRLLIGLVYLPFIFAVLSMLMPAYNTYFAKRDRTVIIKDEAACGIESDKALSETLEEFNKKTKVTPAIITISNETWQKNYSSLEDYAYDRYLAEFKDEMHWLIIYSRSEEDHVDWYWEGMQGDYTDPIITEKVSSIFRFTFQEELEKDSENIAQAFNKAFSKSCEETSKGNIFTRNPEVFMAIAVTAFLLFHAYFMLGLYNLKYRNAEPAPEEENLENYPDNNGFEHL
ncbi:MAG: hypothetical protein IJS61_01875 [Firmicutes bacterium]|nr:hypothetical protein [Bacillota bacterium]